MFQIAYRRLLIADLWMRSCSVRKTGTVTCFPRSETATFNWEMSYMRPMSGGETDDCSPNDRRDRFVALHYYSRGVGGVRAIESAGSARAARRPVSVDESAAPCAEF